MEEEHSDREGIFSYIDSMVYIILYIYIYLYKLKANYHNKMA